VPNFIKIGQTVAEIWRFNGFQNGDRSPSWILEIQFLTVSDPFCIIVPNFVKIGQSAAVILRFLRVFKMAAAAILVFEKFRILTVCPL